MSLTTRTGAERRASVTPDGGLGDGDAEEGGGGSGHVGGLLLLGGLRGGDLGVEAAAGEGEGAGGEGDGGDQFPLGGEGVKHGEPFQESE